MLKAKDIHTLKADVDTRNSSTIEGFTAWLIEALNGLLPEDRVVMEHRFGLNDKQNLSLSALAEMYGVSRGRITQRERRAIRILRGMYVGYGEYGKWKYEEENA